MRYFDNGFPSEKVRKLYWILCTQIGIDPRLMLSSLRGMPRYIRDFIRFRAQYQGQLELMPCLHDWYKEGGTTNQEYFWQDLLVARMIFDAKPEKHVDIGSRIDGFIAHVASFRDIEVFDIRPISTEIPGVIFRQADLMNPTEGMEGYCDSLSCLHALEHFGLGRYGDPIDPKGFERGLANMAILLKNNGAFYLSVPIGMERVEFNAKRVFDPESIMRLALKNSLQFSSLTVLRQGDKVVNIETVKSQLKNIALKRYSLGIFTFVKKC